MPLLDHFRPPLDLESSWEELHSTWPITMVAALAKKLSRRYAVRPRVHLGTVIEIDVGAFEAESSTEHSTESSNGNGGVATAVWAPPRPTLDVLTNLPEQDEYEVRIYDTKRHRQLVAAIELISPANKDRPENRRAFLAKCAALLQQRVSVAFVDIVTTRHFNLYEELLEMIGHGDHAAADGAAKLYAAACRWTPRPDGCHLQTWVHTLALGQPLPTLPIWIADDLAVPLELESSYEEACRILRIA